MTKSTKSKRPESTAAPETVLITGSARRIGRAIALDLALHGWRVAIHYRNSQKEAENLVEEINATGAVAHAFAADLRHANEVSQLIEQCHTTLGQPTCLINNASEFLHDSIAEMTEEVWETHLAINLKAPIFLARNLANGLPKNTQGNVINIIDQRVWKLTPEFFSYTISKSGLWTATRMLAQALAPRVRVNAIGPGPVLKSVHQTHAEFAAESRRTLLGHGPDQSEIAAAVRFILATPSLTGQMIALDGGQHLTWNPDLDEQGNPTATKQIRS